MVHDDLERGRAAAQRREWGTAFEALTAADARLLMAADDLDLLGTAAALSGDVDAALRALQRAHTLHAAAGNLFESARSLFWICFHLGNRGDGAQVGGWVGRANRLLHEEPPGSAARAYVMLPSAYGLVVGGQYEAAHPLLEQILTIARQTHETDLLAFALLLLGRSSVREGQVPAGLALIDEAMVGVLADELSPLVAGAIYCAAIDACQELAELRRASEWTSAMASWCDQQPQMNTFPGQCLVHRSELLRLHGRWSEAAEQAERAGERFLRAGDAYAVGGAYYQQAEGHRLKGDIHAAEDGYRRAADAGYDPYPGLALLRLAQGKTDAAVSAINRVLAQTNEDVLRCRLLPAQVQILLATDDHAAAHRAADELTAIAGTLDTPALRASADQALGAVLLAQGDAQQALMALTRAHQGWRNVDAPYDVARVRVLIGEADRALNDEEAAEMEWNAARAMFKQLGAAPDLAVLDTRTKSDTAGRSFGLSARELEVLRLVATGATNSTIARQLFLADKTIDRHVSNIFGKLGVSSRAAATAFAYEHQLV